MHRIDWWMKKENQFSAAATSCEGRALAVHGYTILQQQQRKIKSCWKSPAAAFNRVYGFGRCTPPNIGTIYKLVYLLQQKLWFRPLLEAVVRTTRSWEVKKEKKSKKRNTVRRSRKQKAHHCQSTCFSTCMPLDQGEGEHNFDLQNSFPSYWKLWINIQRTACLSETLGKCLCKCHSSYDDT